jgi:altered-inheritance-of-mitochondria protein 13
LLDHEPLLTTTSTSELTHDPRNAQHNNQHHGFQHVQAIRGADCDPRVRPYLPQCIHPLIAAADPSETPVRFSGNLVNTLTHAAETDSSREKALELHIQNRVADELSRLEARESEILAGIDERLKAEGAPQEELALDRNKVQAQVEALRKRLEEIPKAHELDENVKKAREAVVGCLRKK